MHFSFVSILYLINAEVSERKNMIHLNIIEQSGSNSGNQDTINSYKIGASIDKNTSGKVILMENTTTDYEKWVDKSVLGYSTFNNNQVVEYIYNNSLDPDAYYCVRLVTDNNEVFYSSPLPK